MMKPIYPRPVNLTPELETAWQAYKRGHPGATFNGVMRRILLDYLTREGVVPCATDASTLTIP